MQITFLGTGTSTGVPILACNCNICKSNDSRDKRLRSSIYIEYKNTKMLVDCGPDFRYQMLKHDITNLDGIILTHAHRDHIGGLDDVRPLNFLLHKPVELYGLPQTLKDVQKQYAYFFIKGAYWGAPEINLHQVVGNFKIGDVDIIPILVKHGDMDVMGIRIGDFTYITDAGSICDEELEKIKGSKVFVINALRREKHPSHLSLSEAIHILEKIKPQKAYLTHIGHNLGLYEDLEKELPQWIQPAYDDLTITL